MRSWVSGQGLARLILLVLPFALIAGCSGLTQSESFYATDKVAELDRAMQASDFDRADDLIDRYDDLLNNELALDLAVRSGNVEAVRYYVVTADINAARDADGVTPLIRAVQSAPRDGKSEIVRLLLDVGANPRVKDNFGRSALDYAGIDGSPELVRFMETGGKTFYNSRPLVQVSWLPERDWRVSQADGSRQRGDRNSSNPVLRASPLQRTKDGIPDLLLGSAWLPEATPGAEGPFTGLRFHVDGSGEVMRYYPRARELEPREKAFLAWIHDRQTLRFAVLDREFAALCESANSAAGRFEVNCINFGAPGGDIAGALAKPVNQNSARSLLTDPDDRARLRQVGTTTAVLESSAAGFCTPKEAPARLQSGLPVAAASNDAFGDWVVFDRRLGKAWGPDDGGACTQRQARSAAFRACAQGGGTCRSVGGCRSGEVTAVASVQGHEWAWLGCDVSAERARDKALAACKQNAGCDCQLVHVAIDGPTKQPAKACRR